MTRSIRSLPPTIVRPIELAEATALAKQVVDVYEAAFAGPPYDEGAAARPRFTTRWHVHQAAPGWRAWGAWSGDALIGFVYGHTAVRGLPWVDAIHAQLSPARRARWCAHAMLVCELAVVPAEQGRGVGGALHDAVFAGADEATGLLTTLDDASTSGARLYARRGWRTISKPYVAPGYGHRYVVKGRPLVHGR